MNAVADADLVILLTASADSLLDSEHLAPGAVVLDATQPRNTSPDLAERRPDVLVVDGGVIDIPSLRLVGGNIGLPDGRAYACFAETALLSLTGHHGHFAIGAPALELVEHTRALARDLSHLGFTASAPTSFGVPVLLGSSGPHWPRRSPWPREEHGSLMRRVVLLGGGYVTLHAYHQLARRLVGEIRRGEVEIVVISADPSHSFHGFTGEVVAGILPFERTRTPITRGLPAGPVRACPGARGRHRSSHGDLRARSGCNGIRHLRPARRRNRRARAGRHGTGVWPKHGWLLRAPGEIEALAARVASVAAGDGEAVVVAGGGLAGVELAAAMAERGRAGSCAADRASRALGQRPALRATTHAATASGARRGRPAEARRAGSPSSRGSRG